MLSGILRRVSTRRALLCASGATLALALSQQAAQAQTYDVTFDSSKISGSFIVTTNGVLTTGPNGPEGYTATFIQGTVTDTNLSPNPVAITGLGFTYHNPDNLVQSLNTPSTPYFTFPGLAFTTAAEGQFNIWSTPSGTAYVIGNDGSYGAGGNPATVYKDTVTTVTAHPTLMSGQTYDETTTPLAQSTVVFEGGTFKPTTTYNVAAPVILNWQGGSIDATNGAVTVSGVISGPGGLSVWNGTTNLSAWNTYTGNTEVNKGATLALWGAGGISGSEVYVDGTLDISHTTSGASIVTLEDAGKGTGVVNLGAQTLTLTNPADTYTGAIWGAGGLHIAAGSETLTGANTYAGWTTIDSGATLALWGTGSIAASSSVIANGTFDISNTTGGAWVTSLAGSGWVNLGAQNLKITNAADTFSGVIQGTGGIEVAAGTETLSGANTFSGDSFVDKGATLVFWGSGSAANAGIYVDGTLDISHTTNGGWIGSLADSGHGTGQVILGDQTLTLTNASDTFTGNIWGTGGLHVMAGTETLAGVNGYTGWTTIDNGATLALWGSGSIASSSGVTANGTFDISNTTNGAWITTLAGSGWVNLGAQNLTLTNASGTFSGVIQGSGGVAVTAGTEALSGANTFSGDSLVANGATLALWGAGSAANAGIYVDGTLDISNTTNGGWIGSLADSGHGTGQVILGDQTLTLTNASDTFTGNIWGTGGLHVMGGIETLAGANAYTGWTTIDSGATLALWGSGSIAASSGVTANGVLDISNTSNGAWITTLAGSGWVDLGAQTLTLTNASGTFSGVIQDGGASAATGGWLVLASGTEVLSGANTYTGGTWIDKGAILVLGAGGTTGSIATNVVDNGDLVFNHSNTVTFGWNISGSGTMWQAGTGTTILNGMNTVTGEVYVANGTLEVGDAAHPNAVLDAHLGGVDVWAGATLSGHGTIVGAVTNTSGGTVAPGGTIGTLTVGSYTQGANSTLAIEVSPTASSELVSLGPVTLAGTLALTFDPGTYAPHMYQFVTGSSVTGSFSNVTWSGAVPSTAGAVEQVYATQTGFELVVAPTGGAEAYGGLSSATLDRAQSFASMVENRFGDAGCADGSSSKSPDAACHGMGAWATVIASDEHQNSNGTGSGFSNSGYGFVGGLDKRWDDGLSIGVAFGYTQDSFSMSDAHASASGSSYYGSLYERWVVGKTWFDGQAFYMHSDWSLNRQVAGIGTASSNPGAETEGLLFQASTAWLDNDGIRPYLRAAYAKTTRSGVTETGVGTLGFVIDSASDNSGYVETGLLLTHNYTGAGGLEARPAFQIGYQQTIGERSRDVQGSLWGGDSSTDFTVSNTAHAPAGTVVLDGSLKVKLDQRFEVWGGVRGRFGTDLTEGSASLGGVYRF
jgi:autotransporter-associated beta strand protein